MFRSSKIGLLARRANTEERIMLSDVWNSPDFYRNLDNPVFYSDQDESRQIYDIMIADNFNLIYLYNHFENLSNLSKIWFSKNVWNYKSNDFFKNIEYRTDIIEYIMTNDIIFTIIKIDGCFMQINSPKLSELVFEYLLKNYSNIY